MNGRRVRERSGKLDLPESRNDSSTAFQCPQSRLKPLCDGEGSNVVETEMYILKMATDIDGNETVGL